MGEHGSKVYSMVFTDPNNNTNFKEVA